TKFPFPLFPLLKKKPSISHDRGREEILAHSSESGVASDHDYAKKQRDTQSTAQARLQYGGQAANSSGD
ncbi:MAG TPA: hypothetical protein VGC95_12780, partial [Chitinophagaceae bacterium]